MQQSLTSYLPGLRKLLSLSRSELILVYITNSAAHRLMQRFVQNRRSHRLLYFQSRLRCVCIDPLRDQNTSLLLKLINSHPLRVRLSSLTPLFSISSLHFVLHLPRYQKSTSSASSEASETCQSVSECNSPTAVSTACFSSLC